MTLEQTNQYPVHLGTLKWGNYSVGFTFPSNYVQWLYFKPQRSASESNTQRQTGSACLTV